MFSRKKNTKAPELSPQQRETKVVLGLLRAIHGTSWEPALLAMKEVRRALMVLVLSSVARAHALLPLTPPCSSSGGCCVTRR